MFTIYSIVEIIKHRMLAKLSWKNKMIKYKGSLSQLLRDIVKVLYYKFNS